MCFPRSSYFLETMLGAMQETVQFSDYPLENTEALKQKFFKIVDAGNVEVLAFSPSN